MVATLAELCVYRFDSSGQLDGGLIAALERMELDDDVALLDALFVIRDPASGAAMSIDLEHAVADGTFAPVLDFRLDSDRRSAISRGTLADHAGDAVPTMIEQVSATLDRDAAVLVVLVQGNDTMLRDAVQAARGRLVGRESVPGSRIEHASSTVGEIIDR